MRAQVAGELQCVYVFHRTGDILRLHEWCESVTRIDEGRCYMDDVISEFRGETLLDQAGVS